MCWNPFYALLLLGATGISYFSSLLVEKERGNKSIAKTITAIGIILNMSVLILFKYADFIWDSISAVISLFRINCGKLPFSLILPVGISFYIFQSVGYLIDVYRGMDAEHNFFKYALFISFFPQLVAGPIERADNILPQFDEEHVFDFENVKRNLLLMLWGYFLKIVIADRISIFVDSVYATYETTGGSLILVASILFAFQIYCDFQGYTLIAIGAAGAMGFNLMSNFKSPYCAVSVKDFWDRWHISLTSWFRDYLYIPLGGNKKGKVRKQINRMIVFLASGLWHGAMWNYVIWGALNGLLLLFGDVKESVFKKINIPKGRLYKAISIVATFLMIDFTWIFFRADGTRMAFALLKQIATSFEMTVFTDGTLFTYGLFIPDFVLLIISIMLLMIVDCLNYNGVIIRDWVLEKNTFVRWFVYIFAISSILLFGIWGSAYDATSFIYFRF